MLFNMFNLLKGSMSVDRIKKYCRDSSSGILTPLGRRDSLNPEPYWFGESQRPRGVKIPSGIPLGIPCYSSPPPCN